MTTAQLRALAEGKQMRHRRYRYGQESDRRATQEAGFDAHLVKPVDLAALARLVGNGAERVRETR